MSENGKNQANNNKSKGKSINNGELRHSYSTPKEAVLRPPVRKPPKKGKR